MRRGSLVLSAVVPSLGLAACSLLVGDGSYSTIDYGSASVTDQVGDPNAILDFANGISIPEGSAASADIALMSQRNDTLAGGNIESADPTVLDVVPVATNPSGYAFLGVNAGTTGVQVSVTGQLVQTVSATVTPPPASSLPPTLEAGVPPVDAGDTDAVAD